MSRVLTDVGLEGKIILISHGSVWFIGPQVILVDHFGVSNINLALSFDRIDWETVSRSSARRRPIWVVVRHWGNQDVAIRIGRSKDDNRVLSDISLLLYES